MRLHEIEQEMESIDRVRKGLSNKIIPPKDRDEMKRKLNKAYDLLSKNYWDRINQLNDE